MRTLPAKGKRPKKPSREIAKKRAKLTRLKRQKRVGKERKAYIDNRPVLTLPKVEGTVFDNLYLEQESKITQSAVFQSIPASPSYFSDFRARSNVYSDLKIRARNNNISAWSKIIARKAIAACMIFALSGVPFLFPLMAKATISNGANAVDLLGQYDDNLTSPSPYYTTGGVNAGGNTLGLNLTGLTSGGTAVDTVNHRLFISDTTNHRVLVHTLTAGNLLVDYIPDFVLGQADFSAIAAANTQSGLNLPKGLAFDSTNNRLFVVEDSGNRVKVFNTSSISNGENAVNVLGQSGYTTATAASTQAGLSSPTDIAYDSVTERIYVSQIGNHRVSVFDVNPSTISNGANAVDLLGQYDDGSSPSPIYTKNLTNNGPNDYGLNPAATTQQMAMDEVDHRLFVADGDNNRILVYNLDSSNNLIDRIADNVIGQVGFYAEVSSATQAGIIADPRALAYDSTSKRLFVGNDDRVTVYDLSSGITNGMNASYVLGQSSFTGSAAANTQAGLNVVVGLAYDSARQYLFVSESTGNRVKVFNVATSTIANGANAINVLGQTTFTGLTAAVTQGGMSAPKGIAYDNARQYLYVAQSGGNRVTVYDVASITDGENAINVLGQSSFTASTAANTQSGMNVPVDVSYDQSNKRLFVTEATGNRVKVFDLTAISDNENAVNVLGQSGYTTATLANTQAGMNAPQGGLYASSSKQLFVIASTNNRITIYDAATSTIANGANAVDLLGQFDDSINSPSPIYTRTVANNGPNILGFDTPTGIAVDSANHRLFVADQGNNRVLVHTLSAGNLLVDYVPDFVLGQANFYADTAANTQSGLNAPSGLSYDSTNNRLFVAEPTGQRVKVFDVASISNGENAVAVLGQSSYTTATAANTQAGMSAPRGVTFDSVSQRIYVPQSGNNRVSFFAATSTISNGASAVDLLGQYDDGPTWAPVYTKSGVNNGPNKFGYNLPKGVTIDTVDHRLFVSDNSNNRVLVYNLNSSNVLADKIPDYVLGQANFYSGTAANTQAGLNTPWGLAYDSTNKYLFVSQDNANRVSIFNVATSSISNGMNAAYVLGQSTFTGAAAANTQAGMNTPTDVAYDSVNQRLFVAQFGNHRVTVYNLADGITNGESAINVLGQSTFTATAAANTQAGMNAPHGVEYDAANQRLFVSQGTGNRITVFDVGSITDGENAINVLGQSSFTAITAANTQSGLNGPRLMAYDSTNKRLFVAEYAGNRVKVFDVTSISDGENAINILGQSGYTTATAAVTQAGMDGPSAVEYNPSNGRLFVTEHDANRMSIFDGAVAGAPGVTVSPTSGLTTTEAGGTTQFTVVLDAQPTNAVSIAISSNDTTEGTVSTSSVYFTSSNWDTPQTITLTGVNDDLDDGDIAYSIVTGAASSSDSSYTNMTVSDVSVTNTDNDTAGVTVDPTSGLTTTESGGTASFTMVLGSQPANAVAIDISSNDTTEGTVSTTSVYFTTANWNTPQTITVTGVNDALVDGNIAYSIVTAAASSSDAQYTNLAVSDVSVTNSDNDVAGITVNPTSGLTTTEAGGTDSFTVVLNTQPTNDVSIAVSSDDTTEGTVSTSSIYFTTSNWSTPQTITVTGVNDVLVDGNIAYNVVLAAASSSDSAYNNVNPTDVAVTNTDNDTAGVTVNPTSGLTTTEAGGTDSFTVVLNTEPTNAVAIPISSADTTEGTVSTTSIYFTTANWNTPQTVTVTGVNDVLADGNIAYTVTVGVASSSDSNYNNINPSDVSVTNTDNDTAGITVNPTSGLTTTEAGGTDSFTIVLNTQPTNAVSIAISSNDTTEGTVSTSSVYFTTSDWNTPQTITVTGVNDALVDGNVAYTIVTGAASSSDSGYSNAAVSDVSVTNTDNDSNGITVTPTSGLVTTEAGGTDTFTVVLNSEPTHNVAISLTSTNSSEGTASPSSLLFTTANWNTPQTVTVTGVNDSIDDGNVAYQITGTASSSDSAYNNASVSSVSVTNNDNDTAGATVTPTSGLTTTEVGGTDSFTIVLNAQPTNAVSIAISSSDTTEGTVSTTSVYFTAGNWNTAQTITVTGVNDALVDGNISYSIVTGAASSSDSAYSGIAISDVSVTNSDNDTGGITVTPTSGLTTTEAGGSGTFTVVLSSEPTHNVAITLASTNAAEGTGAPASLIFTSSNWSTPQTVTVTGTDDNVDDGNIAYQITGTASSSDSTYSNASVSSVSVTNTDNDTAGLTVTPTSGLVTTEAGGTDTFTIVLNSQPTANVTAAVSSSNTNEGTVSTSSVVFTVSNWNTPRTVTVTGVDDATVDGTISYQINISLSSSDSGYSGLSASVSVGNTDNDSAQQSSSGGTDPLLNPNARTAASGGSGGGGGSTPETQQTQTAAVPNFIAQIPQTVTTAIDQVKKPIQEAAQDLATNIGDFFQDVISIIPGISTEDKGKVALIPEKPPLVFAKKIKLLEKDPVENFVFGDMPAGIQVVTSKFPQLKTAFEKVDVTDGRTSLKLAGKTFIVPDLTDVASPYSADIKNTDLEFAQIPISELPQTAIDRIPSTELFARTSNEKIDLNLKLSVLENGEVKKTLTAITGQPMKLFMKPEHPARSITGELVLYPENIFGISENAKSNMASAIMSLSAVVSPKKKVDPATRKLVLEYFEYTDEDGDGLYEAVINAPVEGRYKIETRVAYVDITIPDKMVEVITVIDPEGYIFESIGGQELRIKDAKASIYWKNPETDDFELWPADDFQQINPQITDKSGNYSFLVPEGSYYLTVSASGYKDWKGEEFVVSVGSGIHQNIELKKASWWRRILPDWF